MVKLIAAIDVPSRSPNRCEAKVRQSALPSISFSNTPGVFFFDRQSVVSLDSKYSSAIYLASESDLLTTLLIPTIQSRLRQRITGMLKKSQSREILASTRKSKIREF